MKAIDLSNQRFGRLVAISLCPERRGRLRVWRCVCDCGNEKHALAKTLRNGGTRSCGCLHLESALAKVTARSRPVGFERMTGKGYLEVKTASGFRRKHMHIMEEHIGRRLRHDEAVHHIDGNKLNNDISNLQLMKHAEHTALHNRSS